MAWGLYFELNLLYFGTEGMRFLSHIIVENVFGEYFEIVLFFKMIDSINGFFINMF